jgi:hypothetical protein
MYMIEAKVVRERFSEVLSKCLMEVDRDVLWNELNALAVSILSHERWVDEPEREQDRLASNTFRLRPNTSALDAF